MNIDAKFNQAVALINQKVTDLQQITTIELTSAEKKQKIRLKIKEYEIRRNYLIESKDPKNDYAIQQYAMLIEKMKLWLIAEKMK